MSERLTFINFEIGNDSVLEIGGGVVPEMAQAFGYELPDTPDVDNLGGLIAAVGPAKELQENIGLVQEKLGTDNDAVGIATDWVERTGLLLPVSRSYMDAETDAELRNYDVAVITGGVRNWMMRRAERLLPDLGGVSRVALVAGNRPMKTAEGPDVEEGMTEAEYMGSVISNVLAGSGVDVELVPVESQVGDEIMDVAAERIDATENVLVSSNAGAWVQNAGQLRRALRSMHDGFDETGNQLFVVSDYFPVGTGKESTSTHQNPFTALGQIARNAQELVRHQG